MTPRGIIQAFYAKKFGTQPCLNIVPHAIFSFCLCTGPLALCFQTGTQNSQNNHQGHATQYMCYHFKQKVFVYKTWEGLKRRRFSTSHFVLKIQFTMRFNLTFSILRGNLSKIQERFLSSLGTIIKKD